MKKVFLLSLLCLTAAAVVALNPTYEAYITQYAPLAALEQTEHGIPASITLAQGLLESAAGQSDLAQQCNNHFGIKCGSNWNGRTITKDDDRANECFRCYDEAIGSYEDHSKFLTSHTRYSFLFDYNVTNYRAWANGLARAGYATDSHYSAKLIRIIETYKLNKYAEHPEQYIDNIQIQTQTAHNTRNSYNRHRMRPAETQERTLDYDHVYVNSIPAVLLRQNTTIAELAADLHLSRAKLIRCNELPNDKYPVKAGDYIYLRPKRHLAAPGNIDHTVHEGESLHDVAQHYGLKLSALYKLNNLPKNAKATVGMKLILR